MEIINLKNNEKYLREYIEICSKEWGTNNDKDQIKLRVDKKIEEILSKKNDKLISALGLIDKNCLIGFISLLRIDGKEKIDLTPWYGTMYVKEKFRNNGYSKILNGAILNEAKRMGYSKVYLKTTLTDYYEKFGAKYLGKLSNGESLYYIELQ